MIRGFGSFIFPLFFSNQLRVLSTFSILICVVVDFFFFFVTEDVPFALYMFGWMENGEFEIALEESTFCRPRINKTFSG